MSDDPLDWKSFYGPVTITTEGRERKDPGPWKPITIHVGYEDEDGTFTEVDSWEVP